MIRLQLKAEPRWLDLGRGVRVRVRRDSLTCAKPGHHGRQSHADRPESDGVG